MKTATGHKTFSVGTLTYTKPALCVMFFWVMWNDFSIHLLEEVTRLTNILMRDRGASFTLIAGFETAGGLMVMVINPLFSTWSDRLRTRFGRRRPILAVAVPLFAISLCAIPFMPELYHYSMRFPFVAGVLNHIPVNGEVLFVGVASFINGLFNAVVLAIFGYYYWDVVPESLLGRFGSIGRIITVTAAMIWNFFIIGYAEHSMKGVFIGVSGFCLTVYMLSIWRVKEGEYPPPEPRKSLNIWEPLRKYFNDCFSQPYYLWIFLLAGLNQMANKGNNYQMFYFRYDLGMDLGVTGWIHGVAQTGSTIFGLLLGYTLGSVIDRFKPVRVIPVGLFFWSMTSVFSFFLIHDKYSAATWSCITGFAIFIFSVASGAMTVEVFPREKLGQFCSARQLSTTLAISFLNPCVISPFFDWLGCNRAGFLWSAAFNFLAGLVAIKVYHNWRKKQAQMKLESEQPVATA